MNASHLLTGFVFAAIAMPAMAERDTFALSNPTYRSECGSCHVPYPPALLPKEAWKAIVSGLNQHFGTDASVDAKTASAIEAYLVANAGRGTVRGSAAPRITETPWFVREHREVPAALWKSAAVKSPANCSACHPRAEQGDFREHDVRLPKP